MVPKTAQLSHNERKALVALKCSGSYVVRQFRVKVVAMSRP